MIVLDTTVLVYAVGTDHPLREPSRKLVEAIADGRVDATTTLEVIQEFVHVRARRCGRPDAVKAGRSFADLLSPLLPVPESVLADGLRLFERSQGLGVFDALLAATAVAAGAEALVSADRGFSSVARLSHVAPATPAFDRLLAR